MSMKEVHEQIRRHVDTVGHSVIGVGGEPDKGIPTFSYTIGLTKDRLPELLTFGLPMRVAQVLLNEIAALMRSGAIEVGEDPVRVEDVANFPLYVCPVWNSSDAVDEYCVQAGVFFGPDNVTVAQVVWPDEDGKFPWENGFNQKYSPCNPLAICQ